MCTTSYLAESMHESEIRSEVYQIHHVPLIRIQGVAGEGT